MSRAPATLWSAASGRAQPSRAGGRSHHVHRVGGRGQLLQNGPDARRNPTQRPQLGLVGRQLVGVGQVLMHEQMGHLLELAPVGDVEDVVAAVMEVVAGASDGAQRRVAGDHAR